MYIYMHINQMHFVHTGDTWVTSTHINTQNINLTVETPLCFFEFTRKATVVTSNSMD